ncbi:hypothetical protein EV360DRAFT_87125 [Lentinula raphanica]|nr:hypothetical protein EV360DRAFT_87125 [Lentinula raphanica]
MSFLSYYLNVDSPLRSFEGVDRIVKECFGKILAFVSKKSVHGSVLSLDILNVDVVSKYGPLSGILETSKKAELEVIRNITSSQHPVRPLLLLIDIFRQYRRDLNPLLDLESLPLTSIPSREIVERNRDKRKIFFCGRDRGKGSCREESGCDTLATALLLEAARVSNWDWDWNCFRILDVEAKDRIPRRSGKGETTSESLLLPSALLSSPPFFPPSVPGSLPSPLLSAF